jgi:hypothetical protein
VLAFALALIGAQVIDLQPHETLLLVRMSPKGLEPLLPSERLFRVADVAMGERARFALVSPEQAGVDEAALAECELDRRLSCWAAGVRGKADRLLVVSMVEAKEGSADVTSFLVDVAHSEGKSENEIFEKTIIVNETLRIEDDAEFESYFRKLIESLVPPKATGAIEIAGVVGTVSILLDGMAIGVASTGRTTIQGVAPGGHEVVLRHPDTGHVILSEQILVRADAIARVNEFREPPSHPLRTVTIWSGVGVAVVGVGVLVAALALAPSAESVTPCPGSGCVSENERRFYRPGGVLLAPLGYSLIGAGGVAGLGAALIEEDLWIALSIGAGIVLGATAYGISAAIDR